MASKRGAGPSSYSGLFFSLRALEDTGAPVSPGRPWRRAKKGLSGTFSNQTYERDFADSKRQRDQTAVCGNAIPSLESFIATFEIESTKVV